MYSYQHSDLYQTGQVGERRFVQNVILLSFQFLVADSGVEPEPRPCNGCNPKGHSAVRQTKVYETFFTCATFTLIGDIC